MSVDEVKLNNELVEDVSDAEELQDELVEDEQVQDEDILEAKAKNEDGHGDDDEEEDVNEGEHDSDDDEDKEPVVEMPKTKAAIMAGVNDMVKKAKKEQAQKIYAQVAKMLAPDVEEPKVVAKEDVDVDVSHIDYQEDLDTLVAEEATLSDGFKAKASVVFEAALKSKVAAEVERLESEYVSNLEEEVSSIKTEMVEKVDSYLNYVVSNWMEENEVAINNGLRTEIAEDFMTSLQQVFKEHYVEVPEGKVDLVDELSAQVSELEESLNKSTEDNIKLTESVSGLQRSEIVRKASSDLALTEAEKLASLVEDIDFDDAESFEMKVNVIKESYFKSETVEVVSDVQVVGTDEAPADVSDVMARYTQAITKFSK
jgi:hypothetical protein